MVLHVRFDGKVLIPVGPVDLPTDRVLEMELRETTTQPAPGSREALLEMLKSMPKLEPGDIEALRHEIRAGRQLAKYEGIFDEKTDSGE
jgi:hypothetical protein